MRLKTSAFSLMELVVVITLIGIITAVSVPNLQKLYGTYNLKNGVKIFETALAQGFSESRAKNETITISAKKSADFFYYNHEKIELFPQIKFSDDFRIIFTPPFGDITKITGNPLVLGNANKVVMNINEISGLVTITKKIPTALPQKPSLTPQLGL